MRGLWLGAIRFDWIDGGLYFGGSLFWGDCTLGGLYFGGGLAAEAAGLFFEPEVDFEDDFFDEWFGGSGACAWFDVVEDDGECGASAVGVVEYAGECVDTVEVAAFGVEG